MTITMITSSFASEAYSRTAGDFLKSSFEEVVGTIKQHVSGDNEDFSTLIKTKFVKNIVDTEKITSYVFKDIDTSEKEELVLGKYLSDKIINDYIRIITNYKYYDRLYMKINKTVVNKKKWTGKVYVTVGEKKGSSVDLTFSVSRLDAYPRIYDVAFGGVSLVKTYKSVIKSKYKRNGRKYIDKILVNYGS